MASILANCRNTRRRGEIEGRQSAGMADADAHGSGRSLPRRLKLRGGLSRHLPPSTPSRDAPGGASSAGTGEPGLSSALPQLRSGVCHRSPAAPGLHAASPPRGHGHRPRCCLRVSAVPSVLPAGGVVGGIARTLGLLPEKQRPRAINTHF